MKLGVGKSFGVVVVVVKNEWDGSGMSGERKW